MLSLKSRQDGWRLLFTKEFFVKPVYEKYSKLLKEKKSFILNPVDFINETIQGVQVLGFQGASMQQQQHGHGLPMLNENRFEQNRFLHTASDYTYRSEKNPLELIDKQINITFRHTLGYINYFMLYENFFYLYSRDTSNDDLVSYLYIDIPDEYGNIYCRICLSDPIIDTMDMLDLNYTQPIAQSQTFQVQIKYSNIDFQFITVEDNSK